MKLFAISDLHVNYRSNRDAIEEVSPHPDDWLIIAGDVAESEDLLSQTLRALGARFQQLLWVPGNHELWTVPGRTGPLRGVARYDLLVSICRDHGVLTPEDPFPVWPGEGPPTVIAPTFVGYDYSFAPNGFSPAEAVAWARVDGIIAMDEQLLHPDPHPTRQGWCHARGTYTEERLRAVPAGHRIVLVNHWPLRRDLVRLYRIPRYIPWCGTRRTEDWHQRFPLHVVVSGHLHMRATDWRDHVRFEEVALGYPRHWRSERGIERYLREILPGPDQTPPSGWGGPIWHR
jgi:3',5'-cyclic AMP phosphodiesterase CpdA